MNLFLLLDLMLLLPAVVFLTARRDLLPYAVSAALCAIPFAFTEPFFINSYWSPEFSFRLLKNIPVGAEDVLFVSALAAICVSVYPFFFNMRYLNKCNFSARAVVSRAAALAVCIILMFLAFLKLLEVPVVFSACASMLIAALLIAAKHKNFRKAGAASALITGLLYTAVCAAFELLMPNAFASAWNASALVGVYLWKIPLEEIIYGVSSGFCAAVCYPWIAGLAYSKNDGST